MSAHRLGRGFEALPIEEQVRALRDHALGQELLIRVLLTAVERLGVHFVWPGDEDEPAVGEDED
jgi:hypothetical protein